ncbi:MAG: hypothetical protein KA764_04370 [Anaerolineales bacterium]|nr:hypothetical protein [Anaerolineales bacterium]
MFKSWLLRGVLGAAFALPMMLVSAALVQADDVQTVPTPAPVGQPLNCRECHDSFYTAVDGGQHGLAATLAFQTAWEQQGSPEACLSCHAPAGLQCDTCHLALADHPNSPASVDRSPERCGTCHQATELAWQVSQHGEQDMTCVDCHDAHATGQEMKGDASMLCANCHQDSDSNFAHEAHLTVTGIACADCHLTPLGDPSANPHLMRDHSFNVKVATCNECHTSQALAGLIVVGAPTPAPTPVDPMASALDVQASTTPQPVSPVGYALLSIFVGFGVGIVVAPWVERRMRRPENR